MTNLHLAITQAGLNQIRGLPRMAAILDDGNGHFFIGLNSRKSHPLQSKFSTHPERVCMHAEISAITQARQTLRTNDLSSFSLSVARICRKGKPVLAQPCPGCFRAIKYFNIRKVEWT